MAKTFNAEEIKILKANPYTLRVSEKTISFSKEFKEAFWEKYQAGERPRCILQDLGYDPEILGDRRAVGITDHIKDQILSPQGLRDNKERAVSAEKKYGLDVSQIPPQKAVKRLQTEVLYLRQEMAFIKKIISSGDGRRPEK